MADTGLQGQCDDHIYWHRLDGWNTCWGHSGPMGIAVVITGAFGIAIGDSGLIQSKVHVYHSCSILGIFDGDPSVMLGLGRSGAIGAAIRFVQ